jgi:hypothetical protein
LDSTQWYLGVPFILKAIFLATTKIKGNRDCDTREFTLKLIVSVQMFKGHIISFDRIKSGPGSHYAPNNLVPIGNRYNSGHGFMKIKSTVTDSLEAMISYVVKLKNGDKEELAICEHTDEKSIFPLSL